MQGRWSISRKLLLVSLFFLVEYRMQGEQALPTCQWYLGLFSIAYADSAYVSSNRPPRGRCSPPCSRHHCRTSTEKPRSLQPRTLNITNATSTAVRRERSRHHRLPGKAWSQKDEAGWILGEVQMLVIFVASGWNNWIGYDTGKARYWRHLGGVLVFRWECLHFTCF